MGSTAVPYSYSYSTHLHTALSEVCEYSARTRSGLKFELAPCCLSCHRTAITTNAYSNVSTYRHPRHVCSQKKNLHFRPTRVFNTAYPTYNSTAVLLTFSTSSSIDITCRHLRSILCGVSSRMQDIQTKKYVSNHIRVPWHDRKQKKYRYL